MAILNYTTSIAATRTVGEIQEILAKGGASKIMIDYNFDREPISISFQIEMPKAGPVAFRLPCDWQGVLIALDRDKVEKKYRNPDHAKRVSWRIIKNWVEAQLAFIHAEQATMLQVFLPYAVTSTGETIYDRVLDNQKLLN